MATYALVNEPLTTEVAVPEDVGGEEPSSITTPEKSGAEWGIALLVFAGSCLYLRLFYNYTALFGDEGILLEGGQRILGGQVLYRDFFSLVTPGSYYWMALLFRIFGNSILVARGTLLVYGGLFSVLAYLISRRVCHRGVALLGAYVTTIACLPYWFVAVHNWDSTLLAFLALYCGVRALESRHSGWAAATGSFAALTGLFEQSKGAGLVVGMALGLALIAWSRNRDRLNRRGLAALLVGFAWPIAVTFIYFGNQHSLRQMITDWLWPLSHYSVVNRACYGDSGLTISALRALLAGSWLNKLSMFFVVGPYFLVPALPILAIGFLGFWVGRLRPNRQTPDVATYYVFVSATLAGLLLSTLATGRPDFAHLMFEAPLFLLVLTWGLNQRHLSSRFLHTTRPLVLAYIIASFTAFSMILLWPALSADHILRTRRGVLKTRAADAALDELDARVQEGQTIFVYPDQPLYYYLSGTRNPTKYEFLFPGMYTREQFEGAFRDVEFARTPVVLFETTFIGRVPQAVSGTPIEVLAEKDPGADFILPRYRPCSALSAEPQKAAFVFMVRKGLGCAGPF